MRGSARKEMVARGTCVCDAREFCVCGSALFPLKGATRTDHDESNGISLAGDLWEWLGVDSCTLCERSETTEKKKERFHDSK
jgi:hypothetical protein